MDMQARLSTMWVFVMLNIIFADILSFLSPEFLAEVGTGEVGGIRLPCKSSRLETGVLALERARPG